MIYDNGLRWPTTANHNVRVRSLYRTFHQTMELVSIMEKHRTVGALNIITQLYPEYNLQNGYPGLYEEGEVEHINCVWPVFLTQQLI